jgi:hypothetical protein
VIQISLSPNIPKTFLQTRKRIWNLSYSSACWIMCWLEISNSRNTKLHMQQYQISFSVDNFTHKYAQALMDASRKLARSKHRKPKFMFMWCHLNVKHRCHMRFEGITGAVLKMQAIWGIMTCLMVAMYQLTWHNIS